MIKQSAVAIDDFSGGQDTKTPIIKMTATKSPNMRNWHCAGVSNRLVKRGGYSKLNSGAIPSGGLDVAYPPGYQTYDYKHRDTATHTSISQGFKPKTSSTVTKVRLWLKKVGAAAGDITLTIQTDAAGVPSGTPVADGTSNTKAAADLSTSYGWCEFTFAANPSVVAGTQYHICITSDVGISDTIYVAWGADDYDVIFPDGSMSYNDGATWVADASYDAIFEVYITGGVLGNDGYALWDFNSKRMLMGVFGTSVYKMDKTTAGTPDGTWDALTGGSSWDSYVKLMIHFDGADAAQAYTTEDDGARTVTFAATAQLDTAQKKFGTASLLLDGNSDYVTVPNVVGDWDFADGDFTIDFWLRFAAVPGAEMVIISHGGRGSTVANAAGWSLGYNGTNLLFYNYSDPATITITVSKAAALAQDTWYHIALVRSGDDFMFFVDGTQVGTTVTDTSDITASTKVLTIGSDHENGWFVNGWVDEVRISKGVARWTANFTAPTAAYSKGVFDVSFGRNWTFADWQSGRMLLNTDMGLYTYTGTGNISTVGGAPIGKFLTLFKNYAFIAGVSGYPNQIRYSALNDYTAWSSSNSLTIHTNDGDVITGIRELRGRLYVFKRYSIHRISYVGSNPTFQVDPIIGIGCPSHYTIKEVDMGGDVGTVLVFPTMDKKLAVFNGYDLEIINDVMTEKTNDLFAAADDQPMALSDMNYVYSDLFHAQVKKDTSEYILYCVLNSDTSVNYAFVFDYKTGGIFPYDGQPFASSCIAISTNKSKLHYCSGYTGYTWVQESGSDDDGSSINAYWVSSKFLPANLGLLSKSLRVSLKIKQISSASEITMGFQYRLDWNTSWNTVQTFAYHRTDEYAFGKLVSFDIHSIHNMLQVKISHNSSNLAPTLYGVELYGEPLGVKQGERATS